MGYSFRANRLAGSGRAREVEGERKAGGMPLAKAPFIENEIVLRDLRQCGIDGASRSGRQNDITERPSWDYGLQRAAAARSKPIG
jgi:hypothetical protein